MHFFRVLLCQLGQGITVAEQGGEEQVNVVFLAMRHRPKVLESRSCKPTVCTAAFLPRLSGNNPAF